MSRKPEEGLFEEEDEEDDGSISGAVFPSVVELNVGGSVYTTSLSTLTRENTSLLGIIFSGKSKTPPLRDTRGRYFLDRDGHLFRFILDFLRNTKLVLPEDFSEKDRLQVEAEYYRLPGLVECIKRARANQSNNSSTGKDKENQPNKSGDAGKSKSTSSSKNVTQAGNANCNSYSGGAGAGAASPSPSLEGALSGSGGFITVGYRGTFAFGRDGLADVQFRKLLRIIVCGKVSLCKEVFKDTLNESRDPDRGPGDRYTSRFFLKHNFLEQAFDMLLQAGFVLGTSCATGANSLSGGQEQETEESRWLHYNEFIFHRPN